MENCGQQVVRYFLQQLQWQQLAMVFIFLSLIFKFFLGNIVPVTNHGRIACIVFALFGAPLAIITIGDLGKFLSECTIWLYRKIRDKMRMIRYRLKEWSVKRSIEFFIQYYKLKIIGI